MNRMAGNGKALAAEIWAASDKCLKRQRHNRASATLWRTPPLGWFKLNCDGSCINNIVGGGGVLRDHEGAWILGFATNFGEMPIYLAELWAAYLGIKMAVERNISFLHIELDSTVVCSAIIDCKEIHSMAHNLVLKCRSLIGQLRDFRINHIYQEGNIVADALAKHGASKLSSYALFTTVPEFVTPFMSPDCLDQGMQRIM